MITQENIENPEKRWCIDCRYEKDDPATFPCCECADDPEKPCYIPYTVSDVQEVQEL